jgi:murein DD-endopeptidase MepM/ murein hydrolase activator NlpD
VLVEAEDSSFRKNRAQAEVQVRSDNTPPRLTLDGQPEAVPEGHTWLLRVQADEPASVEATLDGRPLDLQVGDGFGWAIVGIDADAPPRDVALAATGTDQVGNRSEQRSAMHVVPFQYTRDTIQVSDQLAPLLARQVRADEDAHLAPTYANVSQPRLWSGPFRMPAQGEIVTQFGEVRSYNGGPFQGHHTGVDIAVPLGRPVLAPARGRVVLIDQVKLRGNIVVIDHGLGVFTTYAHLSAVDVQVGQEVQAGQPFAKVGTTGLSEGPHLHWELWVRGVNVDPLEWTTRSFP